MDEKRAIDIASSPIMVNVTFHGKPIYIENVNESKHTANIHLVNQPSFKEEVSLINLVEH